MGSFAPEGSGFDDARNTARPGDEHFAELRALLVGPETTELRRLRERLDSLSLDAEEVSRVLAEAVALRSARDNKLRTALQPTIEAALKGAVQKNPRDLADALFPIIGPAIRKAVASAFQGMVESLNQTVEQSFSVRGFRWRVEAWRTGRSFGEMVVLRSALFRVEQVFLIHRETGLLLEHRVAGSGVVRDPTLVSGMLTAIQDFVGDSFGAGGGDQLETMRVGDYAVWIQHGPRALLASVVRGVPPPQLKPVFENALEKIHQELGAELEAFRGDASPFAAARVHLDACLLGRMEAQAKAKSSRRLVWALAALMLLVAAGWTAWKVREQGRWSALLGKLSSLPGVVVTRAEAREGRYYVSGLRDPLSAEPARQIEGTGISPERVSFHWEPYESSHSRFAAIRRLNQRRERVEAQAVFFKTGSAEAASESLAALAGEIRSLIESADSLGRPVAIEVFGYTDPRGPEQLNAKLAQERADTVAAELVQQGVSPQRLRSHGAGHGASAVAGLQRRVSFRVLSEPERSVR